MRLDPAAEFGGWKDVRTRSRAQRGASLNLRNWWQGGYLTASRLEEFSPGAAGTVPAAGGFHMLASCRIWKRRSESILPGGEADTASPS